MKTAIITGASSGIGEAVSKKILDLGYKVYGIGRNFKNSKINNDNFIKIECDLRNIDKTIEIISDIKKREDIFILVNNAGVGYFGMHEEINPTKISEMVKVNFEIPMIITNLLLRKLKENKGFLINISSITAKKANTYGCVYGATKAGLTSFGESLFEENRKYSLKVVNIHPDMTKSNFYRNANFDCEDAEDSYINVEDISNIVDFLLKQRQEISITDITVRPQKHKIKKNKKEI